MSIRTPNAKKNFKISQNIFSNSTYIHLDAVSRIYEKYNAEQSHGSENSDLCDRDPPTARSSYSHRHSSEIRNKIPLAQIRSDDPVRTRGENERYHDIAEMAVGRRELRALQTR